MTDMEDVLKAIKDKGIADEELQESNFCKEYTVFFKKKPDLVKRLAIS